LKIKVVKWGTPKKKYLKNTVRLHPSQTPPCLPNLTYIFNDPLS
jgi:hypothetical protein